jgi:hypothetical protein
MTMQHDQHLVKQIAQGGSFDPVEAIRAIARLVNIPAKEAPPAVMDAEAQPKKKSPGADTAAK